jgi:hypothetical protein
LKQKYIPDTDVIHRSGRKRRIIRNIFAFFIFGIVLVSCGKKIDGDVDAAVPAATVPEKNLRAAFANPDFLMELSSAPLWFEFRDGSLATIASPEEASLNDFTPWALAPHVTGIVPLGAPAPDELSIFAGGLAFAVNTIGFLTVFPWETESDANNFFAVKRIADDGFAGITCSQPFRFNGRPSVILFNVDFFSDIPADMPNNMAYSLFTGDETPKIIEIPAFSAFPANENWEISKIFVSFVSKEKKAYFSAEKSDKNKPRLIYCRTDPSLNEAEYQEISLEEFRQNEQGSPFSEAPPLLRALFDRLTAETADASAPPVVARVYSQEEGAYRTWYKGGGGDELEEYFGFLAEYPAPFAALCTGGGLLAWAPAPSENTVNEKNEEEDGGQNPVPHLERLPPLPEGFVWTALSFCGNALAAAWEEREEWSIGAAGLAFWYINNDD